MSVLFLSFFYQSRVFVFQCFIVLSVTICLFIFVCIGHYSDDNRIIRRIEQENGIESDEDNQRRTMFQANYQYTPLKDYAATRNHRTNNDYPPPPPPLTNSYQSK